VLSKLNRMDEKLEYLTRRVNLLASRSGNNNSTELPAVPQGMVLPADTIRDMKSAVDCVVRDDRVKKNLVGAFTFVNSTS